MFGRKKKNNLENSVMECMKAYEELNKILDQKTIELDKLIKVEEEKQNDMFAVMDYQMEVLKAHMI